MRLIALLMAIAASPALAAGESPDGLWRTEPIKDGSYVDVRVAPCGEAVCGVIEAAHNTKREDLVGQTLIDGMMPDGPGHWASGQIVAPDTNKSYRGSMWLEGDGLKVQGCVALVCREQLWTRLN